MCPRRNRGERFEADCVDGGGSSTKLSAAPGESRETMFRAFERRAAERMSGQRRLRGGKRELIAVVAVSIDSSVKAVRERMTRRARPLSVSRLAVVLALVGALLAPFAAALNKNDLYPYTTPGSSILQSDVNGLLLSAETILKTPIAFYDKIFNSIFVSTAVYIYFYLLVICFSRLSILIYFALISFPCVSTD